jgi:AraC-like DNA-binding protein
MNTLVRSITLSKFSVVARTLGIDPVSMVRKVGLDQACLTTPDLRIPEEALARVLETAARAGNSLSLGLLVGESWRLPDFGVLSLLLQHQPTLRHSLQELGRYRHLLSDSVCIEVSEHDGIALIQCTLVTGRAHPGQQPSELALGVLLALCRFHLGSGWTPRSVHFSHAAPAQTHTHRRILGPRLEFGADLDGIVLSAQDLDRPHSQANEFMAGYARELLELLPRGREPAPEEAVRRALLVLMPRGALNIERVATRLGTSVRSLQRQLEASGCNFQSLLNEVRVQQSTRLLDAGTHSITQIAEFTGFAQTSAFSRWFSRQFGTSPSRWKCH